MVFSNLPAHEKDAFFSILDEYFESRPHLLAGSLDTATATGGAAASAVHRALASNPEATSKLISAGLKQGVPKSSPYAAAAHNEDINSSVGRVAAASVAFSAPPARSRPAPTTDPVPDRNLVGNRKFGDVDTSSAKGFYSSLRNSTANKNKAAPPPVVPSASAGAGRKGAYAPPPSRRLVAEPPSEEEEAEEAGAGGEWAEALYEYSSSDPGDLQLQARQRVLVVERTSDDWWSGELDGRRGLFPASYVKLL